MMRRITILLILLVSSWQLYAQSSVWQVTKDQSVFYLGGTFHILRASDFPLPTEFEKAYSASDLLVFETDIGQLHSQQTQQMILAQAMYRDGSTVEQHLKPETYQLLKNYCTNHGIPIKNLGVFKPSMIALTLTVMEFMKIGMTQDGVDQQFYERAIKEGKDTDYFESIEQQVNFITTMGQGNEDEYIVHTINNIKHTANAIERFIAAWKNGDDQLLDKLMTAELKHTPGLYEQLIVSRNKRWMTKLSAFQKTPEIEFILVGAGHLVGTDGLLAMLAEEGFSIKQL